jgi:tetratricopeptide (TPR) repeat protein
VSTTDARLCTCGSGLSSARCCKLNLASLGAPAANRHLVPLEESAARARGVGADDDAERLALDVLELAPGRTPALTVLYEIRKAQGNKKAAAALILRIVTLEPNNFWATNEITLLLLGQGDVAEATRHARNAMRIAPQNAQAHYLMGMVLTEAHRPAVGEYHYYRALELSGTRDPVVLSNLALCLKNQGKMQAARALYTESLAAAPNNLHTLLGFARLEDADRDPAAATSLLDRAEALEPANPSAQLLRAGVLGRMGDTQAALARLDRIAAGKAALDVGEYLEKGRLLDRMGRYEEAFAAFVAGKERLREVSGHKYLDAHAQQLSARLKNFFVSGRLRTLPRAARRSDVAQPLFVLGFPRSGTTLLEQTLSAHPRIAAGDELPLIAEIISLMPRILDSPLSYPEALAELWMGDHREDLDSLRDQYLRRVAQLGIVPTGAAWFTDKMPLNEADLGLIYLLFPESPLLHVTRHPLDVVLSVFSNLLTHGFFCAYALESAARHYVLVMDLVEHYLREINLHYLRVRYEDIVDDQKKTVHQVLAFIGEKYDARCLAFHENRRYARTASYAQVTEKLYDRSRYRYRNYLPQLQPVIPILKPVIKRLGYTI